MPAAVLVAAVVGAYSVLRAAGSWATGRGGAARGAACLVLVVAFILGQEWAVRDAGVVQMAHDPSAAAEATWSDARPVTIGGHVLAVAVLLGGAAALGFRRRTFVRPMSIDEALALVQRLGAALDGRASMPASAARLHAAIARVETLPLSAEYREVLRSVRGFVLAGSLGAEGSVTLPTDEACPTAVVRPL